MVLNTNRLCNTKNNKNREFITKYLYLDRFKFLKLIYYLFSEIFILLNIFFLTIAVKTLNSV